MSNPLLILNTPGLCSRKTLFIFLRPRSGVSQNDREKKDGTNSHREIPMKSPMEILLVTSRCSHGLLGLGRVSIRTLRISIPNMGLPSIALAIESPLNPY